MWIGFPFALKSLPSTFEPAKPVDLRITHPSLVYREAPTILSVSEAIVLLANLPRGIKADKVRPLSTNLYPHRTHLRCKSCGQALFLVRFNAAFEFNISVLFSCSCRGPFWSHFWHAGTRSHWYYRDPTPQWNQLISPKGLPECQPVAKIAKFALKNHFPASLPTAAGLRAVGYTHAWQATLRKLRDHTLTLEDFFERLDGYRHIRVDRTTLNAPFLYEGAALVSAVWITRCALSAFASAKYIELDCSWRAIGQFAYCFPLGIVNNEAIPLGFIITPTEAKLTYEWFFHDLEEYVGRPLPAKCVLSDEGEAIIAFVRDRGWPHFFCWWHLIHKFRGCRILQIMVIRILRLPEKRDFLLELETVKMQLTLLVDTEYVSLADAKTFAVFLGYSVYPIRDGEECHYRHGVWDRHHIEDCATTAHNERIHRTTEGKTEAVVTLPERLRRAEEVITTKCKQFTEGVHQQRQRLIKNMIAQKADQTSECQCESCRRRTQLLARRYGVKRVPCKHTVKDFVFPPDDPTARALPASLPSEPEVHVSDVDPWAREKRKPRADPVSLDAFVNRADPIRPGLDSENSDDAFLIRVMREAAKSNRHKNKQQLMFDIDANYWEENWNGRRGDRDFRAKFWFSWVANFRPLEL